MKRGEAYLKEFVIPFSGLKTGAHKFTLNVKDVFFETFVIDGCHGGEVNVHLNLIKHPSWIELEFDFDGELLTTCDRCLEEMKIGIANERRVVVKFGSGEKEPYSEEILWLDDNEHQMDMAPLVYEFIHLEVPMRHVHEESECSHDMIDKLKSFETHESNEITDPRWDALKKLK